MVKLIQAECAHVTEFMKEQILRRLSGAIQLPECLKAVGYLRRLGLFTEAELRRHFLSCRGRWIQVRFVFLGLGCFDPLIYWSRLSGIYCV